MEVACGYLLASAWVDQLLSMATSVTMLICRDVYVPCLLPATLKHLSVDFQALASRFNTDLRSYHLADVLVRLQTCGCVLDSLTLNFGTRPRLPCQNHLPTLRDLRVSFTAEDSSSANLQWLHTQPCHRLHVEVVLEGASFAADSQALCVVQQHMHALELKLDHSSYILQPHEAWQNMEASTSVILDVRMASDVPDLISTLPVSPWVHIRTRVWPAQPLVIHWSAMADKSLSVYIEPLYGSVVVVHVLGFPGMLPYGDTGQPWQFWMHGDVAVHGLPPSDKCKTAAYLLQNQAAKSGWQDTVTWHVSAAWVMALVQLCNIAIHIYNIT